MPANANSGRSSLSANQTTSFFLVSGFGSGAYSAKLLAGTKHRFSGLSHMRQCGDDVLRMLVTGGPPARGGWRHAPPHHDHLASGFDIANHRSGVIWKHARHRLQVTDVAVDDPEQSDDRGLIGRDAVEICTSP
jgi:hypothetical protein